MALPEYIKERFNGSQAAFAKSVRVSPPQVTQWINKDFIVVDDILYSPRREL
jgi:DNA-binding transcriptional regulator YdaS (Cro superfamily)